MSQQEKSVEVLSIARDGRTIWRGKEVESDEDFRKAMMDIHRIMTRDTRPAIIQALAHPAIAFVLGYLLGVAL